MFFVMGINDGHKELEFSQMIICDLCGAYGRFQVYMTYTVLSLFFIPCFKWNRRYYVRTSCCGAVYELDALIGAQISRGEQVEIQPAHLHLVRSGEKGARKCSACGYSTNEDFAFCPKCGREF